LETGFNADMDDDILIVGVDSLIGSALVERATERGIKWTGTSRRREHERENIVFLDLAREESVDGFFVPARVAYFCAAATNLRQCEEDFPGTYQINVEQTFRLAKNLAARGTALVFLSTNLVFDGSGPRMGVDAPVAPQTAYGRQKAGMEKLLRNEFEKVAIMRLTKVVHPRMPLFQKWLADLRAGMTISPVSDLVFSPVDLSLVTGELLAMATVFRSGIYQLSGDQDLSYWEAARLLANTLGLDSKKIAPKTCAEAGLSVRNSPYTTLEYRSPGLSGVAPASTSTLEAIFREMSSVPNQ